MSTHNLLAQRSIYLSVKGLRDTCFGSDVMVRSAATGKLLYKTDQFGKLLPGYHKPKRNGNGGR